MKRHLILLGLTLMALILLGLIGCQQQPQTLTVKVDNGEIIVTSDAATVRETLTAAGVALGPLDRVNPDLYVETSPDMVIVVTRVEEQFQTVKITLPFEQKTVTNEALPAGETRLVQLGINGEEEITYRRVLENGIEIERTEVSRVITTSPLDEILAVGARESLPPVSLPGTVAYLSAGNAWLMRDNSSGRRPLTTEGDLDGRVFELSPDGRALLFSRRLEGTVQTPINQMWMISTTIVGEEAISLPVRGVLYAEYSADGTQIAYSTAERTTSPPGWRANNDLWLIPSNYQLVTQATRVISPNTSGLYSWWGSTFKWSPDGSKFAFGRADQIGIIDAMSGTVTTLAEFPALNTYSEWVWTPDLSWSPDGRFVAATVHGPPLGTEDPQDSQAFDLWFFAAESSIQAEIAPQVGMWASPSWSQAGVVYGQATAPLQSVDSRYALVLRDHDGSNPRRLFPVKGEPGVEAPPQIAWSPDETQFIFVYNGNLYLEDIDGTTPRQLTSNNQNGLPRWSAARPKRH